MPDDPPPPEESDGLLQPPPAETRKPRKKKRIYPNNQMHGRNGQMSPLKGVSFVQVINGIAMVIVAIIGAALKIPALVTGFFCGTLTILTGSLGLLAAQTGLRSLFLGFIAGSIATIMTGCEAAFSACWIYLHPAILWAVTKERKANNEADILCAMVFFGGSAAVMGVFGLILSAIIATGCCDIPDKDLKPEEENKDQPPRDEPKSA